MLAVAGCCGIVLTQEEKKEKPDSNESTKLTTEASAKTESITPLRTVISSVKNSLNMLKSQNMLLACLTFGYSGFHFCFQAMIMATCIAETKSFGTDTDKLMGMNGLVTGLGQVSAGILLSTTTVLKNHHVMMVAMVGTCTAVVMIFFNFGNNCSDGFNYFGQLSPDVSQPNLDRHVYPSIMGRESVYWLSLIPGFLLGFSYSALNTQIYAFMKGYYPDTPVPAFAIFKFIQSVSVACVFYWFSKLDLGVQCASMIVLVVVSCSSFYKLLMKMESSEK